MPRDSALARIVVVATLAVVATVVGLSLTSPDGPSSNGGHQNVAASRVTTATTRTTDDSGEHDDHAPTTTAPTSVPAAPPAVAPVTTTTTAPPPVAVSGGGVAIGDSVLEDVALYAPSTLNARGIAINAAVSRQWSTGEGIVAGMRASGRLPAVVVVALGSNGPIHPADFDNMMSRLSGVRRVVFMTVTGPLIANNDVIRDGVSRYPQAVLADWAALSAANPTWFAKDHVHVGAAGAAALGQLFASVV